MKNTKKLLALTLAVAMISALSACSDGDVKIEENSTAESTADTTEKTTSSTESTTTSATTSTATVDTPAVSDADTVKVYYGWGAGDEADYTAEIHCPDGASFSDSTLENNAEYGSVMMASVEDEANEYIATSVTHWHRDAYNNEPTAYPIIAQLYFDGALDAETEAEYTDYSQKVTPLGYKWNGYDVIMIETTYTFEDYYPQTEIFAGVEYDLEYWKNEEGTGNVSDLVTKGLFGFDLYSYSFDELSQEKCAWITGELFGVDSGIENPFVEKEEEPVADVETSALIGKWVDYTSDWEDTYIFNADGTGSYESGFEYSFTYTVDGNMLTVEYDEEDIESYNVTVEDSILSLVDKYGYEQCFDKCDEETEEDTEEETESTAEDVNPYIASIVGCWKESETGYDETFTFNADGTGWYSSLSDSGTYECGFTYTFYRSDYVEICYDDGDEGGFQIVIEDDVLTVRNEYVWDLAYTRQ